MCEFISWVEKRQKVYFLTGETVFSDEFQAWAKGEGISPDDNCGHGTIRAWYKIDQGDGISKEQKDFSSPKNFPFAIVEAIKHGQMRGLAPVPKGLLIDPLDKTYWAKKETLDKTYWAKKETLYKTYCAKGETLDKDYWDLFLLPQNRAEAWVGL